MRFVGERGIEMRFLRTQFAGYTTMGGEVVEETPTPTLPRITGGGRKSGGACALACRSGFTFMEVLFAIVLLGIGFIMLAGMFPVAIRQTQSTMEETAGSTVAQGAVKVLEQIGSQGLMPPTVEGNGSAEVWSFNDARMGQGAPTGLWASTRGNVIVTGDRRIAWVPFYKRNNGENFAQVIVLVVQSRVAPFYTNPDSTLRYSGGATVANDTTALPATLEPALQVGQFKSGGGALKPDLILFDPTDLQNARVAEGCYVVLSDDSLTTTSGYATGTANGYTMRVGNRRADLDAANGGARVWELMLGSDLKNMPVLPTKAWVFVVGRGWSDYKNPAAGIYDGQAQDVAVYTSFIRLP